MFSVFMGGVKPNELRCDIVEGHEELGQQQGQPAHPSVGNLQIGVPLDT